MLSLMEASTIHQIVMECLKTFIFIRSGTPVSEHEVDNTKRQWAMSNGDWKINNIER